MKAITTRSWTYRQTTTLTMAFSSIEAMDPGVTSSDVRKRFMLVYEPVTQRPLWSRVLQDLAKITALTAAVIAIKNTCSCWNYEHSTTDRSWPCPGRRPYVSPVKNRNQRTMSTSYVNYFLTPHRVARYSSSKYDERHPENGWSDWASSCR